MGPKWAKVDQRVSRLRRRNDLDQGVEYGVAIQAKNVALIRFWFQLLQWIIMSKAVCHSETLLAGVAVMETQDARLIDTAAAAIFLADMFQEDDLFLKFALGSFYCLLTLGPGICFEVFEAIFLSVGAIVGAVILSPSFGLTGRADVLYPAGIVGILGVMALLYERGDRFRHLAVRADLLFCVNWGLPRSSGALCHVLIIRELYT
jgi:hypothetical protein